MPQMSQAAADTPRSRKARAAAFRRTDATTAANDSFAGTVVVAAAVADKSSATQYSTTAIAAPFHLPLLAKALVSLALFAAAVSIRRMNPMVQYYYSTQQANVDDLTRALRSRVFHWRPSLEAVEQSYSFRPRVVFLDDGTQISMPADRDVLEFLERKINTSGSNRFQPTVYPIKLRPSPDSSTASGEEEEEGEMDATRYYHIVADSRELPGMERRQWPRHEFDPNCEPSAKWQSSFYPVCNEIHAGADLRQVLIDGDFSLLSNKGFWRHAWRYDAGGATTVWKTFKIAHNFEEKYYEDNRVDAVAMERLTASPYIISLYGFCGLTVVQEFGGKDLAQVLDGGRMNSKEKLKLAKQIAMGVAAIHSVKGDDENSDRRPTLVHNDINMANLMFTADNRPILNDFNIAILLMKNNETGETCPFYSQFPNPQWKAPEEQVIDRDEGSDSYHPPIVNEKIDIYALGNIFFRIAVGSAPWKRPEAERLYAEEKDAVARLKKHNGTLPTIPVAILGNAKVDPALAALLAAMRLCYRFNPAERPTAAEVVDYLDRAIKKA